MYSTLAGTKLTVVKEAAAHHGRKLQQVCMCHATACCSSLPWVAHCSSGRPCLLPMQAPLCML